MAPPTPEAAKLPIVDLSSPDRISTTKSIRQACLDYGFFYLVNHGVEAELIERVFAESGKFFSLPLDEKMKLTRKEHRGYTPLYAETLDPLSNSRGDSKESFYIGPLGGATTGAELNQWPSEGNSRSSPILEIHNGVLLSKRVVYRMIVENEHPFSWFSFAAVKLIFQGEMENSDEETYGASPHSDYGMVTLLATDGVAGLQICRDKSKQTQVWEDVLHIDGAFIVNIGDMMERWTNGLFRSTLHRVMPSGQERYSLAFFLEPNADCIVECLESCCSDSCPKRFPPIRSGDYLKERLRLTYGSSSESQDTKML